MKTKWYKQVWDYIRPLWEGQDKRISVRSSLAIFFSVVFATTLSHAVWKWEAGRSIEGLTGALTIIAGLIVALLGITTIQNVMDRKTDAGFPNPPINVTTDTINVDNKTQQ